MTEQERWKLADKANRLPVNRVALDLLKQTKNQTLLQGQAAWVSLAFPQPENDQEPQWQPLVDEGWVDPENAQQLFLHLTLDANPLQLSKDLQSLVDLKYLRSLDLQKAASYLRGTLAQLFQQ